MYTKIQTKSKWSLVSVALADAYTDFMLSRQAEYEWPTDTGLPMAVRPANFILQGFGEKADSLNIPHFAMLALYQDRADAGRSYEAIASSFDVQPMTPPPAGEKASIMHYQTGTSLLSLDATLLLIVHCNSLVVVRVFEWKDDVLLAYAQGLDKRVEKIACQ